MDPHVTGAIVGATGALIGAIIAGSIALLSGWLSRKHERERSDTAWQREVQRTESEWFREKVLEAYSECMYYSIKLGISAEKKSAKDDEDVRQHYSEAHRNLLLLRAYSTDPEVIQKLTECSNGLDDTWNKSPELAKIADQTAITVGQLLKNDPRIKAPNQAMQKIAVTEV